MGYRRVKTIEHLVDPKSGEVISIKKEFTIGTTTEEFFLVFLTNLGSLFRLKSAVDIKVLAYMCSACQFNTNIVHLTAAIRKDLCDKLGIKNQSLSNSLGSLKNLGLISGDRGSFIINPDLLWKGSIRERDKWMKGEGLEVMVKLRELSKLIDPPTETPNL